MVFGSPDTKILRNQFYQTVVGAGNGVAYKHLGGLPANEAGTFEVAYNEFYGANGIGIGVSAPNSHIHHNLLVDAGEFALAIKEVLIS